MGGVQIEIGIPQNSCCSNLGSTVHTPSIHVDLDVLLLQCYERCYWVMNGMRYNGGRERKMACKCNAMRRETHE